ncbi:MAG: hypothetical protein CL493_04495 [Actinobacteria bacterium]|nr:hypothetical protein [Actinomycetota bacterium]
MFNKKSFLIILILLFLVGVFNLFSDVTLEYVGISLIDYEKYEISCGSAFEIMRNINDLEFIDKLGINKRSCVAGAILKIINFTSIMLFLLFATYFGYGYFKRLENREDLSDLISILKRRNS